MAAPVLDPGHGRTKTGQLWAGACPRAGCKPDPWARDDRRWGGADPPGGAYVYAPDRKAARPIAHLAGFTGILQSLPPTRSGVDGYGGYRTLAEKSGVTLAFSWPHVRRRFYELAAAGPAPIARAGPTNCRSPPRLYLLSCRAFRAGNRTHFP